MTRDARRGRADTRVGIDTGGTFTDLVLRAGSRTIVHKILSTPDDPARAVLAALGALAAAAEARRVTYGSTVATNALLERRGARVVLVTTAGFEDVIEIGRQARPALYALEPVRAAPLVGRLDRIGVRERARVDGSILEPLRAAEIARVVARVRRRRPQAIAVALLHAYVAPHHERMLGRALARLGVPVTLSHALVREHREYERTSTAVVNAYVAPLMDRHLARLQAGMRGRRLFVMQSNGGAAPPALVRREPVRTVLSGPAGGVVGAMRAAARTGITRILTFDMGGTSTDVALIDGAIPRRNDFALDDMAVRVPVIDIHTVGAGGGSIARRDAGGSLRVGPESAGADPGPACYGRGTAPTVTDANLVLGRLDPARFLGGEMTLDPDRAARAVDALARQLRLDRHTTAEGIVRVANAAMARALRVISVERGHDPRRFTLVAFGGAAGLHACDLAADLGLRTVLVPRHPGLLSASGMAEAALGRDVSLTVRLVDPPVRTLAAKLAPLVRRGAAELHVHAGAAGRFVVERFVSARYRGQAHEIEVPLARDFRQRFDAEHARLYGRAAPERPVEVVALRAAIVAGAAATPRTRAMPRVHAAAGGTTLSLVWNGRRIAAPSFVREALAPGARIHGPALVVEYSSTLLVAPGWTATVDAARDLMLVKGGRA